MKLPKKELVLFEMLSSKNHSDIISIIDRVASDYIKVEGKKFTIYAPKKIDTDFIPLMASHTDTVSEKKPTDYKISKRVVTNPNGVLGADDRAGCYGLYKMMEAQVQAYYLFTDEEEVGGIGAGEFADSEIWSVIQPYTSALIELDRRGHNDVATYGYDNVDLIELFMKLGYEEAMGSYTDVVDLSAKSDLACVNISIGYYNEHSKSESLNLNEMNATIDLFVNHMPKDFYIKKFEHDGYTNDYYNTNAYDVELLCDVCGEHKPLYELQWGYACKDCLNTPSMMEW